MSSLSTDPASAGARLNAMHELSIALSILDAVSEEAGKWGDPVVRSVHLRLGALAGVMKEPLRSAYDLAREGTPLAACQLIIEEMPIVIRCPTCRTDRTVPSIQELCCPECGTPSADVVGGRELEISGLEIEA